MKSKKNEDDIAFKEIIEEVVNITYYCPYCNQRMRVTISTSDKEKIEE